MATSHAVGRAVSDIYNQMNIIPRHFTPQSLPHKSNAIPIRGVTTSDQPQTNQKCDVINQNTLVRRAVEIIYKSI